MQRLAMVVALVAVLIVPVQGYAQQSKDRNLQTCLSGRFPALCDYGSLTPEQLSQARAAEVRENLRVCMTGRYPALCNRSMLTPNETKAVDEAERIENRRVCSTGKFPNLCRHDLLSADELNRVRSAEQTENLRVCMGGRHPALCNRALLNSEQAKAVAAAEARAASATPPRTAKPGSQPRRDTSCESGHWIESVAGDGKIIKLEDGSLWEVADIDTVTTSLWLPVSDVVLCAGKMINVDDGETAEVAPLNRAGPGGQPSARPRSGYHIEASANDETFVINGGVYKAKVYCFNFEKGDPVRFLSGSPSGACATAKLLNLRTGKTCDVWCE